MKHDVNFAIDAALLAQAKAKGWDLATELENTLKAKAEATQTTADQWKRDNAEAIANYNSWITENGLPLAKARAF